MVCQAVCPSDIAAHAITMAINRLNTACDHSGISLCRIELLTDSPGHRHIIGIHPREPLTTSQTQTRCRGSNDSVIKLVPHESEPSILDPSQGRDRSVAGSVIHRDEFKVTKLLPQDTLNGIQKRRLRVAKRKNHRDNRHVQFSDKRLNIAIKQPAKFQSG